MTHPSPEAVERAMSYFAGKPKSFTGMLATLHGKTLAAHVAALTAQLEAERAQYHQRGVSAAGLAFGWQAAHDALRAWVGEQPGMMALMLSQAGPRYETPNLEQTDRDGLMLQSALTRETARADAAEKFIRTISESPFAPFRVQNACAAYLLDASEKRATKTDGGAT